ncbi:THUMP domain-containing protein, partial [Faecalibacterium duncaniae]|uniref:THUMP domain-containing protein n=1 Tax=Faecalibacterium duncaniae (strain DSM 17677 / JCM 31915 / A2-165) TaxID=411483 RepID=UPI00374CF1F0
MPRRRGRYRSQRLQSPHPAWVGDGRLTFAGGPEMIAAANLNLRTVERVMLLLNTYPASTFD